MRSVLNDVAKEGSAAGAGPVSRRTQVGFDWKWSCVVVILVLVVTLVDCKGTYFANTQHVA